MSEAIVLWRSFYAKRGEQLECSWPDLLDWLQMPRSVRRKEAQNGWSPTRLVDAKGPRKKSNILEIYYLVLDLDDVDPKALTDLFDRLEGYEYIAHTTASHSDDAPRMRLVLRLEEPVPNQRWRGVHRRISRDLQVKVDTQCSDPCRSYYAPHTVDSVQPEFEIGEGRPYPVPSLDDQLRPAYGSDFVLTHEALKAMLRKLKDKTGKHQQTAAEALRRIISRRPLAEEGQRDNTLFALCSQLVRVYPEVSPDSFLDCARASIDLMNEGVEPGSEIDDEKIADKIERAKEQVAEERSTDVTWSEAELSDIKRQMGGVLDNRWIVTNNAGHYVRARKGFVFIGNGKLSAACKDLLEGAPITLSAYNEALQCEVPLGDKQLQERYGCFCDVVLKSFAETEPRFEADWGEQGRLIIGIQPKQVLEPRRDARVAKWLRLLGGKRHDQLLQWLGNSQRFDKPLPLLALIGHDSSGKSLLAKGVAQAYGADAPTRMADIFGAYNGGLEECPIVFADEEVPRDWRGNPQTQKLREFIQQEHWAINPKYGKPYKLHGYVRVMVAANNESVLEMGEQRTLADVQAVAQRILHLEVNSKPKRYLQYLKDLDSGILDSWLEGRLLARHIIWLTQQGEHNQYTDARFGIDTAASSLTRRMVLRSGMAPRVLELISMMLEQQAQGLQVLESGDIGANIKDMIEAWPTLLDPRTPKIATVTAALEELSDERFVGADGKIYSVISVDLLDAWATQHLMYTPDQLVELLKGYRQQ